MDRTRDSFRPKDMQSQNYYRKKYGRDRDGHRDGGGRRVRHDDGGGGPRGSDFRVRFDDPTAPGFDAEESRRRITESTESKILFNPEDCERIEHRIKEVCKKAVGAGYKECTVDRAHLRNKFWFGEGYVRGKELLQRGMGNEMLLPTGEVDPIPEWVLDLVVRPIVRSGLISDVDFVNSVVIEEYQRRGCMVSFVEPPSLFSRPIVHAAFLSDSAISFGCKFTFKPIRSSPPVHRVPLARGGVFSMWGYAANNIQHAVRPEDTLERHACIVLRHVPRDAPRLTKEELWDLRATGTIKNIGTNPRPKPRPHGITLDPRILRPRSRSRSRSRTRSRGRERERMYRSRSRSHSRDRDHHCDRRRDSYRSRSRSRTPPRPASPLPAQGSSFSLAMDGHGRSWEYCPTRFKANTAGFKCSWPELQIKIEPGYRF